MIRAYTCPLPETRPQSNASDHRQGKGPEPFLVPRGDFPPVLSCTRLRRQDEYCRPSMTQQRSPDFTKKTKQNKKVGERDGNTEVHTTAYTHLTLKGWASDSLSPVPSAIPGDAGRGNLGSWCRDCEREGVDFLAGARALSKASDAGGAPCAGVLGAQGLWGGSPRTRDCAFPGWHKRKGKGTPPRSAGTVLAREFEIPSAQKVP